MRLLERADILASLQKDDDNSLVIEPLLNNDQIGAVTIDIRLGYDFLVSTLTRKPYIAVSSADGESRGIGSYFQEARRDLGDRFVVYPNQVALATSLEYIALPSNVYADVITRSSYQRLGIHLNTMLQPGFRGCAPVELINHGNNPIEIVVGSRVFQLRLFSVDGSRSYAGAAVARKYYGDVRPTLSKANVDNDLGVLARIAAGT